MQGGEGKLCIVAVAKGHEQQQQVLEQLEQLQAEVQRHKYGLTAKSRALAAAFAQGQLRIAWLDAARQAPFCRFHLKAMGIQSGTVCDGWLVTTAGVWAETWHWAIAALRAWIYQTAGANACVL